MIEITVNQLADFFGATDVKRGKSCLFVCNDLTVFWINYLKTN